MFARALQNIALQGLRARSFRTQELGGNFGEAHMLNVGLRVHVDHGRRTDRPLQFYKRSPGARVLFGKGAARHPHRLIHGKVAPIILEHPQFGFLDLGVGGIQIDQVHRAIVDRLESEAVLHAIDPLRRAGADDRPPPSPESHPGDP